MKYILISFALVYCIGFARSLPEALISVGTKDFCVKVDQADKTIGGTTKIEENRWMAQLEYTNKVKATVHRSCVGSIISPRFILTAAHCLGSIGNLELTSVILGEWDTTSDPDISNGVTADPIQKFNVEKIIVHEDYNKNKNFENDIGLVKVTKDIVYSKWIQPICLPNSEELKTRDLSGNALAVSGWRSTGPRNSKDSALKLKADITGKSKKECQAYYDTVGTKVTLTDNQFCGGFEGVESCRGDAGSSVIAFTTIGNTIYTYLAGIVSFGPTTTQGQSCDVYTKVAAYIPWIETNMI